MFQKSRTSIASQPQQEVLEPPTTIEIKEPVVTEVKPVENFAITDASLVQAWTSYALSLPENERALADRMKIITPKKENDTTFIISVDNPMAAELFGREEDNICEGMKQFLGGIKTRMKIEVNKVVVERYTSDKSKQFAMLVEKNPLVETLHKELNLEISR
jgi:DNA polymerase-3 subunit gamma/tau